MLPYNAWRLLYVASGSNSNAVQNWQNDVTLGKLQLPQNVIDWFRHRLELVSVCDDETLATLRDVNQR